MFNIIQLNFDFVVNGLLPFALAKSGKAQKGKKGKIKVFHLFRFVGIKIRLFSFEMLGNKKKGALSNTLFCLFCERYRGSFNEFFIIFLCGLCEK